MLNKYTILFQIKEARDRRIRIINERTKKHIHKAIVDAIFTQTPFLARLKYENPSSST